MNIRVTAQTQTANAIAYLRQQTAAAAKYQDQISSGLRVKLPSDDPGGYAQLARAKADGLRFDTYRQTMTDATADLNAGVGALRDVNDVLVRAKQIAQEGINETTDPGSAAALATEVDSLIGRVLAAGNTQSADGKYLFGGTATGAPPFQVAATDAAGRPAAISYAGSADRARALIGPGQTVDTRYAGNQVFQRTGADAFQALIDLRDNLRNTSLSNPARAAALTQSLSAVDAARNAIGDTTGEQAAHLAALDALQNRVGDLRLAAQERAGGIAGTDYAEAVVKLNQQQTALQATVAVSAKLLQPTLLDFIK